VLPVREARDLLESSGVAEATAFISSHSHPRLWRILANHCLQQLDLATAEKALVHCQDYPVRAECCGFWMLGMCGHRVV
jgi:hypothetical protein